MYVDFCRLLSNDNGLISYNSFAEQEFLIVKEAIEVRQEINEEIRKHMENESKKKK